MHHRLPGAVSLLAALGLVACSVKESPKAADTGAGAVSASVTPQQAANVVHVIAKDYSFDVPAQIPAGLTTLHLMNQGKELHQAQLIKLGDGKTFDDFMAAFKAMKPNAPPPSWIALPRTCDDPDTSSFVLMRMCRACVCCTTIGASLLRLSFMRTM